MVNAQVKLTVLTKIQINERCLGAEEEVFVCLRRVVLTRHIDWFVMLSTGGVVEAVGKVVGWEANGSVQVMAMTLRLKVEAEAVVVVMIAEVVVEKSEGVAVGADGMVAMAELKALREGGGPSSGKVVVGILNVEVKGEDTGVVPLEGAGGAGHPREVAVAVADSQTVVVAVVGWRMEAVEVEVLRTVVEEAVVLRVAEVAAHGSHSKTLEFWEGWEQALRLSKSLMTSPKTSFR